MSKCTGLNIVVVGAGPVGLLCAIYAAQRGHHVKVYELRPDPRRQTSRPNQGKSLQLTLSSRGMRALSAFDPLLPSILNRAMPVSGRVVHTKDSRRRLLRTEHTYGTATDHILHCICRQDLQKILLEAVDCIPNIEVFFNSKVEKLEVLSKIIYLRNAHESEARLIRTYDLLFGADGAHSTIRRIMAQDRRSVEKEVQADCHWLELIIPASPDGGFRLSQRHLHVWPSKESVFVAMPRPTGDFVTTWFAPSNLYEQLDNLNDNDMLEFIERIHPGIFEILDQSVLIRQFRGGSRQGLCSVRSEPHHWRDSVVLIGDAANTILPFYGQGTNSGFESVQLFWDSVDKASKLEMAVAEYSISRMRDLHCISDLAWEHFNELKGGVRKIEIAWRSLEKCLESLTGSMVWTSEYTLVAFSRLQYSEARRCVLARRQNLRKTVLVVLVAMLILGLWILRKLSGG